MLFFLSLHTVLEWAGAPKGKAAKLLWLANELHLDLPVRMDDKTLRKAIRSPDHVSSRTQKELADFQSAVASRLGMIWPPSELPDEVIGSTLRWHEWQGFALHEDINLPGHFLPKTRSLIQQLALAERAVARSMAGASDLRTAVASLVDNPLARLLCPDIKPDSILRTVPDLRGRIDADLFGKSSPLLRRWLFHCVVSLQMHILAQADLEFCRNHVLPENAPDEEILQQSMIVRILPTIRRGILIRPIPALLERWNEVAKSAGIAKSYRQIAQMIPGATDLNEKARMLRRWRQGKHVPDERSIKAILKGLLPEHEDHRHVGFLRYRIALLLQRFYEGIAKAWPESTQQERVRLFQTFTQHRKKHLSGQEGLAPTRR